jgi:hypothetical protein
MPSPLLPFQGLPSGLPSANPGGSARPFSFQANVPLASGYNISPAPTAYNSTFGGIPGNIGLPNPFQDLSSVLPGVGDLNRLASSDVMSELKGQLSPETEALLQDKGAQFGVSSGMPGSQFSRFRTLRDLGRTSEDVQGLGLSNLSRLLQTISGTETVNPALQAEIASRNATFNAAPVPSQAQNYAKELFDKYLQSFRGPGGGTGKSPFDPSGGGGQQPLGGGGADDTTAADLALLGMNPEDLTSSSSTSSSGGYTGDAPSLDELLNIGVA